MTTEIDDTAVPVRRRINWSKVAKQLLGAVMPILLGLLLHHGTGAGGGDTPLSPGLDGSWGTAVHYIVTAAAAALAGWVHGQGTPKGSLAPGGDPTRPDPPPGI